MMESVKLIECPRDAWQGLQAPNSDRAEGGIFARAGRGGVSAYRCGQLRFAESCAANGRQRSSARATRADSTDVEIIGIVVNEKGAERAIATGAVRTLGYPCSISETFLRRNQNQSPEENQAVLKRIKERADEAGLADGRLHFDGVR